MWKPSLIFVAQLSPQRTVIARLLRLGRGPADLTGFVFVSQLNHGKIRRKLLSDGETNAGESH